MHIRHTLDINDRPVTEALDDDGRVVYRGPAAWVRRRVARPVATLAAERGLSLEELGEVMRHVVLSVKK